MMLLALGMIAGGLGMVAGLALAVFVVLNQPPGSPTFWGWMGAAAGFFFGGGGGLVGAWNSYRQLEGAGDLLLEPHHTWLDNVLIAIGLLGAAALAVALIAPARRHPDAVSGLLILGGILVFQAAMFLIPRMLIRRAARQEKFGKADG